jgi:hypothetical protein
MDVAHAGFLSRAMAQHQSNFRDADLRDTEFRFLKMIAFAAVAPTSLHDLRSYIEKLADVNPRQILPDLISFVTFCHFCSIVYRCRFIGTRTHRPPMPISGVAGPSSVPGGAV